MNDRLISRSNPLVRRIRSLASDGAARRSECSLIAEGVRLVEEALGAGAPLELALVSPRLRLTERGRRLRERLTGLGTRLVETTDAILDSVSDAQTSQGILALVRWDGPSGAPFPPPDPAAIWVVAWGLQDPGNVGTLIRTADAVGAAFFVTVAGTTDPTTPKAVRASAGSVFRVPFRHGAAPDEVLEAAARCGVRLIGTEPEGGTPYDRLDCRGPVGFVFGREGEGLPPSVRERLQASATIPMREGVESLNVAAAAAVLLFETIRQRRPHSAS